MPHHEAKTVIILDRSRTSLYMGHRRKGSIKFRISDIPPSMVIRRFKFNYTIYLSFLFSYISTLSVLTSGTPMQTISFPAVEALLTDARFTAYLDNR